MIISPERVIIRAKAKEIICTSRPTRGFHTTSDTLKFFKNDEKYFLMHVKKLLRHRLINK